MICSIRKIIENNFNDLKDDSNLGHLILYFFLIPFLLAFFIESLSIGLNYNYVISFVSIMVGFLINGVILLISSENRDGKIEKTLKESTYSNIFYSILSGIFLVILIILFSTAKMGYLSNLCHLIINFLLFHFIIMILTVMRRLHSLYY